MKLMTLNIWGGSVGESLLEFIKTHQHIDIFCFQEVYHNAEKRISTDDAPVSLRIFSQLQDLLPDHRGAFTPVVNDCYGLCTFTKKTIEVIREGDVIIHDNPEYPGLGPTHSRKLQWLECHASGQPYLILNVHGLWNGKGKTDSPERIAQSLKIRDFMNTFELPKILAGDFNLRPETESMKILEEKMQNLVQAYNIQSTRTSLYPKEEKYADYILTSGVAVHHFEVLPHEVSDHSPLLLEFT